MAGTVKSKAIAFSTINNVIGYQQTVFGSIASLLDSHQNCSRVASYYGITGHGFGTAGTSNYVGDTAWGVWRFNSSSSGVPFDIAMGICFGQSETFGTSPNGHWDAGTTGLGLCLAWHSSSAAWGGTTNNNGNDSFVTGTGNQPWKSGSVIFPQLNNDDGSSGLLKNRFTTNLLDLNNIENYGNYLYSTVDNDGLYIVITTNQPGVSTFESTDLIFYAGAYQPITSSNTIPLVMAYIQGVEWTMNDHQGGISNFYEPFASSSNRVGKGAALHAFGYSPLNGLNSDVAYENENRNLFYEFPIQLYQSQPTYVPDTYRWLVGRMYSMYGTTTTVDKLRLYNTGSRLTLSVDVPTVCYTIPWEKGITLKSNGV